jgi:FkbM family methyltransferase
MRRYARMVKRAGRLLTGRDVLYSYDIHPRKAMLGTVYGGWTLIPEILDRNSVMYSFGVGNDISFDLTAIQRFGMEVHGFDPSPESVQWIAGQDLPRGYTFHSYGLGAMDRTIRFFAPRANSSMYSQDQGHVSASKTEIKLPVQTLSTIVKSLGTRRIDVLKMDIEGAEYDLLTSIVECPISIRQLLIEFHHRSGVKPLSATVKSVEFLRSHGFQLFHVSGTSSEFSFMHA